MLVEPPVDPVADRRNGYEQEALRLFELDECVFDWNSYVRKRLPVDYPAGGIVSWLRKGLEVTIWHGRSDGPPADVDGSLHFVIEQRGSNHHLEYKLYVFVKSDGTFAAHFRGVLGVYRMRKLQAMLMLVGVPSSCVRRRVDDSEIAQINDDLQGFEGCDIAIVGGLSGIAEQQDWIRRRSIEQAHSGRLVSYEIATIGLGGKSIRMGLLTYPYGDLCKWVGASLRDKHVKVPILVGSAGSLAPGLARGDTSCPNRIYCDELNRPIDVRNLLEDYYQWDSKKGHCSVQTPLQESGRFVARAIRLDIWTADCEVYSFLDGWGSAGYLVEAAIALFVTDEAWRREKDVSQLSYGREIVRAAGSACFEAVGKLLRDKLS